MENIIKKAQEGGYSKSALNALKNLKKQDNPQYIGVEYAMICDPLFWQALGKTCGWDERELGRWKFYGRVAHMTKNMAEWKSNALLFHEINLTEGWEKAVAYLEEVTK